MKYRIVFTLLWLVSLLPFPVLYALSDFLCLFVRRFYRTEVVRTNLASAFPNKSAEELKRIEVRFYHQFCDNFLETIKMLSMSREEMMRRMTFSGLDDMKERFATGQQFCFLYLSHFGNWEWISSIAYLLSDTVECSQIYHHIYNKVMNRFFLELRSKAGGKNVEMKETLRTIMKMKGDGRNHLVGFISDQQPKWNSIHHFTPFLNHDTAVFTGTENIARKLDAFVMYGRMSRPRRGSYHLECIPLVDHPTDLAPNEMTDTYFRLLEADIEERPEMWLWTHKRWKRTREEWERRKQNK